jgi:hypothetical protein
MKENLSCTGCFGKSKDEHMKTELHSSALLCIESWQFLTNVSGQSKGPVFKGQECKKQSQSPYYGVYIGKSVGGGKFSVVDRVDAS